MSIKTLSGNSTGKPEYTRELTRIILVAVFYFATGKLGTLLAIPPGVATPLWPPSGIALAAALLWGYGVWPGIIIGSFFVNITTLLTNNPSSSLLAPLASVTFICAGSALQALAGAYFIRSFIHTTALFDIPRDIFKFSILSAMVCIVAALCGSTSLAVFGYMPWKAYPETWITWWLGDLVGILVVSPWMFLWEKEFYPAVLLKKLRLETVLFVALLLLFSFSIFGNWTQAGIYHFPMAYFTIPFILFAAFKYGRGGVLSSTLCVSLVAIWGATQNYGPFVRKTVNETLLLLQAFIGVIHIMGLSMAAEILERKKTLDALEESEREKSAVLEASLDCILTINHKGVVVESNSSVEKVFGYKREDFLGKELAELIIPERVRAQHRKGLARYLETGESHVLNRIIEMPAVRADGSEFPCELFIVPLRIEGKPPMFTGFLRDITERRLAQTELVRALASEREAREALSKTHAQLESMVKERTAQLEEAQHLAHLGSWEWDVSTNKVTWSDALYEIYGIQRDDFNPTFEGYLERVHSEDRERARSTVERAIQNGSSFSFEERIVRPDGMVRCLHSQGEVIFDKSGNPIKMIGVCQDITERELAEHALRQSEERFRSLVQTIPDIVYRLDPDGKFIFINNAVKYLGYEPEEVLGRHFHVLLHPDDAGKSSRSRVLPSLKGKTTGPKNAPKLFDERRTGKRATRNLEVRLMPKNTAGQSMVGNVFSCGEIISIGQFDRDIIAREKKFLGTVGVIRDVTERKRAENALRESEEMLRSLYEFAPDAILTVSREGMIQRVNRQLENMFLYSRGDLLGKPVEFLLPERFRQSHESNREHYVADPRSRPMGIGLSLYGRRSDGSEFPVDVMLSPVGGREKNQMVIAIVRDITDRKRAEELLRENEERFRQFAENIHDIFWLYDRENGNVIYVSPAYENVWKCPVENTYADSREWMNSVHPEDIDAVKRMFNMPFDRKRDLEYRIVWPDGSIRWLWDRTFPVENEMGFVYRVVRITHDVTDKKFMLDALAKSHHEATLGRLAAIVAHQVNNPLAAMKAGISLLNQDVKDEPENIEKLKVISEQVDRISRTVRTLLGFVRQRSVKHTAVDIGDVLRTVTALFEGSLRAHGIHLEVSVMENIPPLRVNADDLQEIFVNLLENAREALNSGKCIFVTARAGLTGIDICVEDNGAGLGDEPERLFQPFHTTKTTGTGLGLTIVRRLCESYGGNIVAENKPESEGGGACFKIYLPWNQEG